MPDKEVIRILAEKDLRITPQRTAVLEVIMNLDFHPAADDIVNYIRLSLPHVPFGTVYKILDTFVKKGIIQRVKTNGDTIRFDAVKDQHHHLYCDESDRIEDYYDDELNKILNNYFRKKKIPDFSITGCKVQISGKFSDKKLKEK